MVVGDFDVIGTASLPDKTDSIAVVDSDAVLTSPITSQPLQAVPGGTARWRSSSTWLSCVSFLRATRQTAGGHRLRAPRVVAPSKMSSVARSANDRIMERTLQSSRFRPRCSAPSEQGRSEAVARIEGIAAPDTEQAPRRVRSFSWFRDSPQGAVPESLRNGAFSFRRSPTVGRIAPARYSG